MNRPITTHTTHFQVFESLQEQIEAADRAWHAGRHHRADHVIRSRPEFYGRPFSGWRDVVREAGEHGEEGLDLMQEMLHELRHCTGSVRPRSRVRRARWNADDGDEVDIDRLRAGQEPWRQMVRERQVRCLLTGAELEVDENAVAVIVR